MRSKDKQASVPFLRSGEKGRSVCHPQLQKACWGGRPFSREMG